MADFTPTLPYNVPFFVHTPSTKKVKGVGKKFYEKNDTVFYCSFRTFGGTEKTINDVIVIEDTATLETFYDPLIKADCRIEIDGKMYDILGTPENVKMRDQFLVMKVRAAKGGA